VSVIDGLRHRLHVLLRREAYVRDVERELRFHVELETLARLPNDNNQTAAELAARRRFGNATYYREEVRRMTPLGWMDRVRQNSFYAIRGLGRSPGFTATVVITLALGFGVNAAMYTMLDQVFRRAPDGVANPGAVRRLYKDVTRPKEPGGRLVFPNFTFPHYRALAAATSPLELAAFTDADSSTVVDGASRVPARESWVTSGYFHILGLRPQFGRFFSGDEEHIETPTPVAVISDGFWRRAFNADATILGRKIAIDHVQVTIIGIGPKDFSGVDLDVVDVWLPANMYESSGGGMSGPWYEGFASSFKIITRVSAPRDEARILAVGPAAMRAVHLKGFEYDSTSKIFLGSIVEANGPMRPAQEVTVATRISWIALIVLLIACANVVNLLLLRAARRKREIAVRRALGASQARLYEQLAVESTLLAVLGGVAALAVSICVGTGLRRLMMPRVHWATRPVDGHTVLFLLGLSLVIGLGAGLAPALLATRSDLANSLKAGTREGAYRRSRLRSSLLLLQSTLCVVLLVGAGLFLRSLDNLKSISIGYQVDNVALISPAFSTEGRHEAELAPSLPVAAERISHIAGVEAVAYATATPMGGFAAEPIFLPGRDSLPRLGTERSPTYNAVSPGFLRTAGVDLREGRGFTAMDATSSERVLIVSQAMARLYWPGTTAIGKCVILEKRTNPCAIVVGVASDVHRSHIIEQPTMQFYVPSTQSRFAPRTLIVRVSPGRLGPVTREAARILTQTVPDIDGARISRMTDILEPQLRPWRLGASLFTAFGVLALAVAGIGIYSVVAYGVSQRTNEMGIRLALGAQTHDILDLVVGEGIRLLSVGIVLGVLASLALGRYIGSLLFGVTPSDVSVFIGAATMLAALGLLACIVPGWRASSVDPATALRAD
jgi:predicted permease